MVVRYADTSTSAEQSSERGPRSSQPSESRTSWGVAPVRARAADSLGFPSSLAVFAQTYFQERQTGGEDQPDPDQNKADELTCLALGDCRANRSSDHEESSAAPYGYAGAPGHGLPQPNPGAARSCKNHTDQFVSGLIGLRSRGAVGPQGHVFATDVEDRWFEPGTRDIAFLRHDVVLDPLPEPKFDVVDGRTYRPQAAGGRHGSTPGSDCNDRTLSCSIRESPKQISSVPSTVSSIQPT